MTARKNPFEYSAANDLPPEMIIDYYIEDYNYSRFIQSKRNIFLVGERGSGKTMALLYNSWPIQKLRAQQTSVPLEHGLIGVYIPCNTPLTHRNEYQLLGEVQASALSEHFLVLSLGYAVAGTLETEPTVLDGANDQELRDKLEYILGSDLPKGRSIFASLKDFISRQIAETQRSVNDRTQAEIQSNASYTFASLILPLLGCTREIPRLRETHFMLLVDDAHNLNRYQIAALNSWVAYRDHSLFSFKIAVTNLSKALLRTSSGGSILETHDFTRIDMLRAYQNEESDFGHLANLLVQRRLQKFGIGTSPETFLPMSNTLIADLAEAESQARTEAIAKYGDSDSKKISDYSYKYARAYYFRARSPRANRPEYSGFKTLVFLSTGVIRNLLIPCYWMYEKMLSRASHAPDQVPIVESVPPGVQSEVILERSRALWDWLREGLDQNIEGCSREMAIYAYQLMDNLAIHFRERLLRHKSEPRANSFTVSGWSEETERPLNDLLEILGQAQLLYVRSGPAKDLGRREPYYVPNRLLWPERGLDPHGQHARVSLPARDLWAAARYNTRIGLQHTEATLLQQELFDANE